MCTTPLSELLSELPSEHSGGHMSRRSTRFASLGAASRKASPKGASLALAAPGLRWGALRRLLGVAPWLASAALFAIAQPASADCSLPVGDINGDGKTNVADSQCIVLSALSTLR